MAPGMGRRLGQPRLVGASTLCWSRLGLGWWVACLWLWLRGWVACLWLWLRGWLPIRLCVDLPLGLCSLRWLRIRRLWLRRAGGELWYRFRRLGWRLVKTDTCTPSPGGGAFSFVSSICYLCSTPCGDRTPCCIENHPIWARPDTRVPRVTGRYPDRLDAGNCYRATPCPFSAVPPSLECLGS